MKALTILLALSALLGCNESGQPLTVERDDGTDTDKPKATPAESIAYDNTGSRLHDTHVQGALDELAARAPGLPDAADRLQNVFSSRTVTPETSRDQFTVTTECPEGTMAVGGTCSVQGFAGGRAALSSTRLLQRTEPFNTVFSCEWVSVDDGPIRVGAKFTALASCLAFAEPRP